MNEPAISTPIREEAAGRPARAVWGGAVRWYLWDGGFLALGCSEGIVPMHAHHAIQIVLGVSGMAGIRGEADPWRHGRGLIVMPDVPHSFDAGGLLGAMIFVDPESLEGAWLRTTVKQRITLLPDARVEAAAEEIRRFIDDPFEAMGIGPLVRHCVATLCAGAPPARHLDERVTRVLREIRESGDLRVSVETAAAGAGLSPSRFQHLFKQQVGLPFRRYMLWRKLTRALLAVGRERTISAAAQASDFADAAHLTRTFQQMFGLVPSVMMKGEFFVVESPFG